MKVYYTQYERIKRMESALEKLAYISVIFDFLVAVGTYLALKGAPFSATVLQYSGYALLVEVALAAVIFVSLIAIRHYAKIIDRLALATFKNRYNPGIPLKRGDGFIGATKKMLFSLWRTFIKVFVASKRLIAD